MTKKKNIAKYVFIIFIHGVYGICKDSFDTNKCLTLKRTGACDTNYGSLCQRTCGICSDHEEPCDPRDTVRLKCTQKCTLINGNPTCGCYPGFDVSRNDPAKCDDVNECQTGNHNCDTFGMNCHNYVGGSYCDANQRCSMGNSKYYRKNGCCKFDNTEQCGRPHQFYGRIWEGATAMRKQWPWMVHIQYKPNNGKTQLCSGSLIAKNWVITAAHCVEGVKDIYENCNRCLMMYMGLHDHALQFSLEPERIQLTVKRVVIYDSFDISVLQDDIALIEIEDVDLNESEYVKPICLPGGETPGDDTKCFIAGWGETEDADNKPTVLQETGAIIGNLEHCKETYENLPTVSKVRITDHICAVGQSYDRKPRVSDACQGDSGGPLMCQRCENCNWYIAGIVSFGYQCAHSYGVYTSTTLYESWIRSVIEAPRVTSNNAKGLPCRSCCKYIKMSGENLQTSRQGHYELQDDSFGKRKVYKQMHKTNEINYIWFLNGKFNVWFVSDEVGNQNNGGFLSSQATSCPDQAALWRVYDDKNGKWLKAGNDFKTECVEDPTPKWSNWSSWSDCSQGCRRDAESPVGKQERSRECDNGTGCSGNNTEERDCGSDTCTWNEWSEWDVPVECQFCNMKADKQTRNRTCSDDGDCAGASTEDKSCDNSCPEPECCEKVNTKFNYLSISHRHLVYDDRLKYK